LKNSMTKTQAQAVADVANLRYNKGMIDSLMIF
jgi:hypothetical protein